MDTEDGKRQIAGYESKVMTARGQVQLGHTLMLEQRRALRKACSGGVRARCGVCRRLIALHSHDCALIYKAITCSSPSLCCNSDSQTADEDGANMR